MVNLKFQRVDYRNHNTPILFDREIDDYAHSILADYKPELLQEARAINYQHFLESYLGMHLYYQDIYYDDPDRPILALTAFKSGMMKVFNREQKCVDKILVHERTVVMDNAIMRPNKDYLARFSGMHEGGHAILHWHVYTGKTFDGDVFNPDYIHDGEVDSFVCCRRENIERSKAKQLSTAEEWREHQADYFAAAITMPNATFKPFVTKLLRDCGYYKGAITVNDDDSDSDILAEDILPDAISETYGVSKRAARIKLRKTGFVFGYN